MAGIRTAAVWVIGTATLATPIGQTSLGNYIFTGLQTQNWVFVLFGCVAAAVLALAVDQLLALMQAGFNGAAAARRALGRARHGGGHVRRALVPGLTRAAGDLRDRRQDLHRAIHPGGADRQRLRRPAFGLAAAGARLQRGVRRARRNEIDAYVDYSGTIWTNQMHRSDVPPRER